MLALTGYTHDDFLSGRVHYSDIMLPDDLERTRSEIRAALGERRVYEGGAPHPPPRRIGPLDLVPPEGRLRAPTAALSASKG